MGEVPTLTVEGHVFQIDPKTKKQWLPLSSKAVQVSFYHDSSSLLNRIVCVHENKVLINSSLTNASKFTKTSCKFGQWMDHAACTVYGLGFEQEADLDKFAEMFTSSFLPPVNGKDKSLQENRLSESSVQDKIKNFQKANLALSSINHDVINNNVTSSTNDLQQKNEVVSNLNNILASSGVGTNPKPTSTKPAPKVPVLPNNTNNRFSDTHANNIANKFSNINLNKTGGDDDDDGICRGGRCVTTTKALREENEKIKRELAESMERVAGWEEEFAKLRSDNTLLRTSLEENKRNVDGWKKRVDEYRLEISSHRSKLQEMGSLEVQLTEMTERLKVLERMNEDKRLELCGLSEVTEECRVATAVNKKLSARVKDLEGEKRALEAEVREVRVRGGGRVGGAEARQLVQLQEQISHKINELYEMNDQLAEHLQAFV